MKIITIAVLSAVLVACSDPQPSVDSGGEIAPVVQAEPKPEPKPEKRTQGPLSPELSAALSIAKQRADFSGVTIREADIPGYYALYWPHTHIIEVNERAKTVYSIPRLACLLIHEIQHHYGYGEAEAYAKEMECVRQIA